MLLVNILNIMDINQDNIYPVSQARSKFSKLIDQVGKSKIILVTKKGKVKVALIDFGYLQKIKKDLESIYKKTFIDRKLLPFSRNFTDQEIKEWSKEDVLES